MAVHGKPGCTWKADGTAYGNRFGATAQAVAIEISISAANGVFSLTAHGIYFINSFSSSAPKSAYVRTGAIYGRQQGRFRRPAAGISIVVEFQSNVSE